MEGAYIPNQIPHVSKAVIPANTAEKPASLSMLCTTFTSERGPSINIILTRVAGAEDSLEAAKRPSSSRTVGLFFINLCSINFFTLEMTKKELRIAGNNATIPTISTPPTIAIEQKIAPKVKLPVSPGKIFEGNLWKK